MPQYFVVEQIVEYNPRLGDFVSEIDTRPTQKLSVKHLYNINKIAIVF